MTDDKELKRMKRRRRRQRVKLYVREYLDQHPCKACGAKDNLTFHHIDPNDKRMTVSKLTSYNSIIAIQNEIDKCEVLCRHCHDIKHEIVRKVGDV